MTGWIWQSAPFTALCCLSPCLHVVTLPVTENLNTLKKWLWPWSVVFRAGKWYQSPLKLVSRGDCTDHRVHPCEGPVLACSAVRDSAGRLRGKGSAFPSFCYLFGVIPTERNRSSSSLLPTLDCALRSSLPSFHSFCRHMLVRGDGGERAESAGSSSTLPSPEVWRCSHAWREGWGPVLPPGVRVQVVWGTTWLVRCKSISFLLSMVFFSSIFLKSLWLPLCCLQGANQLQESYTLK